MYYMIVQTPFYFDFSAPYKLLETLEKRPSYATRRERFHR
jgi:hypothetical protein